jgi:hypothetical protein
LHNHIHTSWVDCSAFGKNFRAFGLDLLEGDVGEVSHADLSDTRIGLSNISFNFLLRIGAKKRVDDTFVSCSDSFFKYFN